MLKFSPIYLVISLWALFNYVLRFCDCSLNYMIFFSFWTHEGFVHFPYFTCDLSRDRIVELLSFSIDLLLFYSFIFSWLLSFVYSFTRLKIKLKKVQCFLFFVSNIERFVLFSQLLNLFLFHTLTFKFWKNLNLDLFLSVPFHRLLSLLKDWFRFGLFWWERIGIALSIGLLQIRIWGIALVRERIFDGFSESRSWLRLLLVRNKFTISWHVIFFLFGWKLIPQLWLHHIKELFFVIFHVCL